jgi:hypothetical protein
MDPPLDARSERKGEVVRGGRELAVGVLMVSGGVW